MPNYFEAYGTPPAEKPATTGPSGIWKFLDYWGRPGAATAGAIREAARGGDVVEAIRGNLMGDRRDDFDDVLADQGVEDSFGRKAAGFALDLVVDPLNLVPVTPVANLLRKGTKAGRWALENAARSTRIGADIEKKIVPYAGLDRYVATTPDGRTYNFRDARRIQQSMLDARHEDVAQNIVKEFGHITPEDAFEVALARDEGRTLDNAMLEPVRQRVGQILDDQFPKEVGAGVMPAEKFLPNYFPHVIKKGGLPPGAKVRGLSAKNVFTERKQDITLRHGANAGIFEKDFRLALEKRLTKGDRAVLNAEFFEKTARDFGRKLPEGVAPPQGFRPVTFAADAPLKAKYTDVVFPNEIADNLEQLNEIPKEPGALRHAFQKSTQAYKGWLTRANPVFLSGNVGSNVLQTWFGGVGATPTKILDPLLNLKAHVEAFRVLRDPSKMPDILDAAGNVRYPGQHVAQGLRDYGIIGGTHTSFNELERLTGGLERGAAEQAFDKSFGQDNPILKLGARLGNTAENTSRIALALHRLRKSDTFHDAGIEVSNRMFNYGELTPEMKAVRDYSYPFLTWRLKNIPLQIRNAIEQPDKVAVLAKARHASEDAAASMGLATPEEARPADAFVQLPIAGDAGERVFVNPRAPIQDLSILRMFNPGSNQTEAFRQEVLAGTHPVPRMLTEWALNTEAYTGRPIAQEGQTLTKADALSAFLHQQAPEVSRAILGTETTDRGVEMSPMANYLMRNNPVTNFAAKALQPLQSEATIGGIDPATISRFIAPVRTVTEQDIQNRIRAAMQKRRAAEGRTRRDQRRIQP